MSPTVTQVNHPVMKTLNDKQMYSLIVIEENRDRLIQNELVIAQQNLQTAEQNLATARAGLSEVNGAIIGANIFIDRELQAAGFTRQEWQSIKEQHALQHQKSQEEQEANPVDQPAADDVLEPAPPTNVAGYKRRRK